jgi:hypothetical protein
MIQNLNDYNPLSAIKELASHGNYSSLFFDLVRKELFKGGIVFETEQEYTEALNLLIEMEII